MTEKTRTIRHTSISRNYYQFLECTDFARWFFAILLLLVLPLCDMAFAVEKYTLSGYVRDAENNEEIIGASVYAKDTKFGMSTNVYGFYSLTLPVGQYTIRFSSVGYDHKETSIDINQNTRMDIVLSRHISEVGSIIVTGKRKNEEARQVKMGSTKISTSQAQFIPVLLGEQDILKTIQLLPGVQETGEGSIGFHVRGGGSDQNLVLLDEATVFNSGHMLGFFSVFNSDAIKDAILIKGSGSTKYGGRLSSVLDIKMKEGNSKRFQGQAGIGLIASRFAIEGPIKTDRGSFIISGRRTYFDLFLKLSSDEDIRNSQLYFYDLNIKANYHIGKNDRLFLSGYFGEDVLEFNDEAGISWGNSTGTVRWNHIFNNRLFLNSSLIYSRYIYKIGIFSGNEMVDIGSYINTVSLKEDFNYFADHRSTFGFGGQVAYYTILPGEIKAEQGTVNDQVLKRRFALESAVYANHEWKLSSNFSVDYGLRLSSIATYGPGEEHVYDNGGLPISTTSFDRGELIKNYFTVEPRVTSRLMLNEQSSIKASYSQNRQYLHLLSSSTTGTPFDLWHPSTSIVKPGTSSQYSVGYFRSLQEDTYEVSLEVYYRDLWNQIDYKNGADIYFNEHIEFQLVFGKSRAYGAELLIRKNKGRLAGWLSYTLAKTEKKFDAINDGNWFRARQDRTHDIEIAGQYLISSRWTLGMNWIYHTGNAVTFPNGKYVIDDHVINLYGDRNANRMPAYHRLDIAFTWKGKRSNWNFSLYNAYGRRNAYAIQFRDAENDPTRTEAVRIALFTFFPSITYTRSF